jgi:hypothetical protein
MGINQDGFKVKQEFEMGGIKWTIIAVGVKWVTCISSECTEKRAFDEYGRNDFANSSLRKHLNGDFLQKLIESGVPKEVFENFIIDLTSDDGLRTNGFDNVRIGLITCNEYRRVRDNIPLVSDKWWTATSDSPTNSFVRRVGSDGALYTYSAYSGGGGVRPKCVLNSETLFHYLNDEKQDENNQNTHTVDSVPKGKWIHCPECGTTTCSKCGWNIEETWESSYCPDCGSPMEK